MLGIAISVLVIAFAVALLLGAAGLVLGRVSTLGASCGRVQLVLQRSATPDALETSADDEQPP